MAALEVAKILAEYKKTGDAKNCVLHHPFFI